MIIITAFLDKDPRQHRLVITDDDRAHGMEVCETDRLGAPAWRDAKESAHKHTALITLALLVLRDERAGLVTPGSDVTSVKGGIEIALGKVQV
jgi:hypothetical protein